MYVFLSRLSILILTVQFIDKNHIVLSQLSTSESNTTFHREAAASLRTGILDLLWNSTKLAFYDFNLRTQTQNNVFSAAAYTPYWSGITPDQVLQSGENALKAFAPVNLVLNRWNGTFPATFLETGLQWYVSSLIHERLTGL